MVLSIIAYSLSAVGRRCGKTRFQTPDSGPAAEAAVHILPVAETLRQVAPGDARPIAVEDGFDEQAVVRSGHAN